MPPTYYLKHPKGLQDELTKDEIRTILKQRADTVSTEQTRHGIRLKPDGNGEHTKQLPPTSTNTSTTPTAQPSRPTRNNTNNTAIHFNT